jgi:ABC-2 type transport system permease protein
MSATTDVRVAGLPRPATSLGRIYGLGSVFAKTLRDSRLTFLIMAGLTAGLMLTVGAAIGKDMATPEARADLVRLATGLPPVLQGLAGDPVNVGTLGGYLQWKYGAFFALIVAIWAILFLSSTLATEAQRGSLDVVATTPFGKRRIALEKLGAFLAMLVLLSVLLALSSVAAGAIYGTLPGDAIPLDAAVNFALWVALLGLVSGAVAFALSPFVGRGSAAGIAGMVMAAGYLINGYKTAVPLFQSLSGLSWWAWVSKDLPLAGQTDWGSLVLVAVVTAVLLVIGVEAFNRRDLGVTSAIRWPGLPAFTLGTGGPLQRSFGDRLPAAIGWGLGIAFLGFMMGAAGKSLADSLAQMGPSLQQMFKTILPQYDLTKAGSFLELGFVSTGFIIAGFAGSILASGWGSDETGNRLEVVLSAPVNRARWAILGGLGALGAVGVMTVIAAIGIALGSSLTGGDILTPTVGTVVIGLYAAAVTGIGIAFGGLFRASIAGEVTAAVVIFTFLVDLLAPALQLPDWVHQLALTSHLGQPMLGTWDWTGVVACLAIALGGVLVAGWGLSRRDVRS